MLNTILHGNATARPPLVIAHGLFGSGRNWGVIAKRLSADRLVVAVDMRNHAGSDWADSHSYPDMAADLAEVIEAHGGRAHLLGHSMGGKASMVMALTRPELLESLVVADISPVDYGRPEGQLANIEAMRSLRLDEIERRSDADEQLAEHLDSPMLRSFFTQSLDVQNRRWRMNLDLLASSMRDIVGFPEVTGHFDGPVLFLSGAESTYVKREHRDRIKALFPAARFASIPGAGHWLHAEKPREFVAAMAGWLDRIDGAEAAAD